MSNLPEPDHTRIRVHTREGFSRRRLQTLEPFIVRRANELIDAMLDAGPPAEFVAALAYPLPGETVFRFIGFPEQDDELLKHWCGDRKTFSWGHPTGAQQVEIAQRMLSYWRYCRQFTADKRDHRADDFASELLDAHDAHPDDIAYNEVESVIYGLSFAGHEAVTNLICNCLTCLLPRRDAWAELGADPSLIPNAVEEVLRFQSSQISWRRVTTRDTTLAGHDLPAGTRDPAQLRRRQPPARRLPRARRLRHPPPERRPPHLVRQGHPLLPRRQPGEAGGADRRRRTCRRGSRRCASSSEQELTYFPNITFRGPDALLVEWTD